MTASVLGLIAAALRLVFAAVLAVAASRHSDRRSLLEFGVSLLLAESAKDIR